MKTLFLLFALSTIALHAQTAQLNPQYEGVWEGYDGEWGHVSRQLIALAETIPADKYTWHPGPGVRSVGEIYMHLALPNFYLLSITGPKMPADITSDDMEEAVTSKPEVIQFLKRSLNAVKAAPIRLKPGDLQSPVKIEGKIVPVEGMYLRVIVHDNAQLIAYARMKEIIPPWSKPETAAGKN